jgi:hypothetical protein
MRLRRSDRFVYIHRMFDNASRPLKDRVLLPAVRAVPAAIGPMAITAAALVCGVGAAIAAGAGQWTVALVLFAINRILDGLDGLVARYRGAGPRPLTSVVMPVGVVEGTETLVFFTLFLAVPAYAGMLFYAMAAATAVGILQRVVWAARNLPDRPEA